MKKIIFPLLFFFLLFNTSFADLSIDCPTAILIEEKTGKILYSKDIYTANYPASTTKIMTAILVLENLDLYDTATASATALNTVSSDSSIISLKPNETHTVEDLLKGLLIVSGNDAANVLAEKVSGTMTNFINLMNSRARELGCKNTHFLNASGLHESDHYSCSYDIALLYRYAYQNFQAFRDIIGQTSFRLPPTEIYDKDDRTFTTANKLLIAPTSSAKNQYYYEYCTGGKLGYTSKAKNCLVASASKNGINLIVCVLGGSQDESSVSMRYRDAISLFDHGFEILNNICLAEAKNELFSFEIENGKKNENILSTGTLEDIYIPVLQEAIYDDYSPEFTIYEDLSAPIYSGDVIGKVIYTINNATIESDLVALNTVLEKPKFDFIGMIGNIFLWIFRIFVTLVALVLIIRFFNLVILKNIRKNKKRKAIKYRKRFKKQRI